MAFDRRKSLGMFAAAVVKLVGVGGSLSAAKTLPMTCADVHFTPALVRLNPVM